MPPKYHGVGEIYIKMWPRTQTKIKHVPSYYFILFSPIFTYVIHVSYAFLFHGYGV
jgi:hypothetical protein